MYFQDSDAKTKRTLFHQLAFQKVAVVVGDFDGREEGSTEEAL